MSVKTMQYRLISRVNKLRELQEEMNDFNAIDQLNPLEIAGGNVVEEDKDVLIDGDGVDLSINGSDLEEEFPDETNNIVNSRDVEPGEISASSSDDKEGRHVVAQGRKVVKVSKGAAYRSGKLNHLRGDPEFKQFLDEIVNSRMEARKKNKHKESSKNSKDNSVPQKLHSFKSPSDTIIYSPGLRKLSHEDVSLTETISNFVESIRLDTRSQIRGESSGTTNRDGRCTRERDVDVTPKFSHGVQLMQNHSAQTRDVREVRHVEHNGEDRDDHNLDLSGSAGLQMNKHCRKQSPDPVRVEDQLLVQAEKFKARVEAPKGNFNYNDMLMPFDCDRLRSKFVKPEGLALFDKEILFLRNFYQDDEFFHVTSQIEPGLRAKIERDEFVDFERLLPKDRFGGRSASENLNRQLFQLITQGTNTYLDPPAPPRNGKNQ